MVTGTGWIQITKDGDVIYKPNGIFFHCLTIKQLAESFTLIMHFKNENYNAGVYKQLANAKQEAVRVLTIHFHRWVGTRSEPKPPAFYSKKLFHVFKTNQGVEFTIDELAATIDRSHTLTRKVLNKLLDKGVITRRQNLKGKCFYTLTQKF